MTNNISFQALEQLSFTDQLLFSQFGSGLDDPSAFTSVHRAFEGVVDQYPSNIAVEHDGSSLTYAELDNAANDLSNRLIALGLQPQKRVCVVVQRSLPMVIAMLAVLKAGCQYVPLDGQVTAESALRHIFHDTQASYILCLERFRHKAELLADPSSTIVVLDGILQESSRDVCRPNIEVRKSDGAYVIYTSGSTGPPKGVDVSHGNVTNLLCNSPGNLGIESGTTVAQLLSISFDMGQWEILGTLTNGGTLLIRSSDWAAVLSRAHTVISTPSILATIDRKLYPSIKVVALAGEPCPKTLADEWAQQATFYNCCGPTEVTIVNTMHRHRFGSKGALSIGKPVPNTFVYVLDEDEEPVPIGQPGLMWVGGQAVSRGYVNLPDLTSRKYKYDKFLHDGVMFNTGDLCKWRPDGSLLHLGRADDQVKIKGFRVELDSVSASIETTPGVNKACAIFSESILWGFYSGPQHVTESEVKSVVGKNQPYYAVPSKWVFRQELPMTANGKVDKKALLASVDATPTTIIRPDTAVASEKSSEIDLEKSMVKTSTPSITTSTSTEVEKFIVPEKIGRHRWRALRFRIFDLYRRLFTVVFVCNIVAGILMARFGRSGRGLQNISTAIAANLAAAVLMRQELVINFLFTVACSLPLSAPLWMRKHAARVYHIGGLHSGCAVASCTWLVIFTIASSINRANTAILFISWLLVVLLTSMIASAHPTMRQKYHDRFEVIHRFAGWTSLVLFWIQTLLLVDSLRGLKPLRVALGASPGFWLLLIASSSVALPWVNLRKVSVRCEVLSEHAVRMYFKYTMPEIGTAIRLSERPLVEWHAFATIAHPTQREFSVVVSNAGDWTSRQIREAPSKIWVRGLPACGVLRIAPLFRKIVLVATGSGIGPCLPVIYAGAVPARIFWSTPQPEKNFGMEIIEAVREGDAEAVIHDTKRDGRPDMVKITWRLLRESGAEAVCIISNPKLTRMVVYAMEARGVPAYGAIFDS